MPGLGAEGWQVCSLPNSLRSLSGRSRRVMERNNDGKKSRSSQNPGIVTDTRVPWHRLSPATRYRGIRSRSDSWLADTDHPSYIYIPAEMRGDRTRRGQSLLAFPGREVAPEREGSRCAALAAPGLWEMVPPPPRSAGGPGRCCWGSPTSGL